MGSIVDPPPNEAQQRDERANQDMRRRAAILASAPINQGLSRDVMWTRSTRADFELTNGSIFIPKRDGTREAAIFAAVASALQEMRTRTNRKLESRFPLSTVIDPRMYLGGRFNDAVLKAAILRASHGHELTCVAAPGEQDRMDLLEIPVSKRQEGPSLNIEISLASAVGKLPPITASTPSGKAVGAGPGGRISSVLLKVRGGTKG
jgi:hypothetical protein